LAALARTLNISVQRLSDGLIAAKMAGGNGEPAIAAFSHATGTSHQAAARAVATIFGPQSSGGITSATAVNAFAQALNVSRTTATAALTRLADLGRANGGIDPTSPAFVAQAHLLGVSPQQLANALAAAKMATGR
jgi:hypothetical protein